MKNMLLALLASTAFIGLQPALAARNAAVKDAATTLASHIKNGTQGNWGPIPMPPNQVTDDEAKTLATWILTLK